MLCPTLRIAGDGSVFHPMFLVSFVDKIISCNSFILIVYNIHESNLNFILLEKLCFY